MSKTRKWYTRALYLVFALALVVGLAVVPVAENLSADVSQPQVTVTPNSANATAAYTINFTTTAGLVAAASNVTITFPALTTVGAIPLANVFVNGTAANATAVAVQVLNITPNANVPAGDVEVYIAKDTLAANSIRNPVTPGDYRLTVATTAETYTVNSAYYTIGALVVAPTVTSVLPAAGVRDSTVDVVITGTKLTGATAVSFGAGITVNSFTVDSATKITANITIGKYAPTGAHNVTVTIVATIYTGVGIFTVDAGPGLVEIYNAAGSYYGAAKTITTALTYLPAAPAGYTIKVTPSYAGTGEVYPIAITTGMDSITIEPSSGTVTVGPAATAAATAKVFSVNATAVTIQGFEITKANTVAIHVTGAADLSNFAIKDCTFVNLSGAATSAIKVSASTNADITKGTISGCTFVEADNAVTGGNIIWVDVPAGPPPATQDISGVTVSGNTITGKGDATSVAFGVVFNSGVTTEPVSGTIENNTITDLYRTGSAIELIGTVGTVKVSDNTVTNCNIGIDAWALTASTVAAPTQEITLWNNAITDCYRTGMKFGGALAVVVADPSSVAPLFNSIYGNNTSGAANEADLFNSITAPAAVVRATHNWWGDASGPGADSIGGTAVTAYDPWLGASVSAAKVALDVASLDAKTEVGVTVTGAAPGALLITDIIGAALYTDNPIEGETEFTALDNGFFDVYAYDAAAGWIATDEVVLKLYNSAITSDSKVYAWSPTEDVWKECTLKGYSSAGGAHIWVKVHSEINTIAPTTPAIEELQYLPFAISTEEAVPPVPEEPIGYDDPIYGGDGDGIIDLGELLNGIEDYIGDETALGFLLDVIELYLSA